MCWSLRDHQLPNACENQVCEDTTCTVGARGYQNRLWSCRLELCVTCQVIVVFAAWPIAQGMVVCQYWGTHVHTIPSAASYTICLREKDAGGCSIFVSAEKEGGNSRFISHSCTLNTKYVEVRRLRRVVVFIISQVAIRTGEEITVDYTERAIGPLWFHCQCPAHRRAYIVAMHLMSFKKEARGQDVDEAAKNLVVDTRPYK